MQEYQVTLFSTTGKFKPVSCIIKTSETDRAKIKNMGVVKICQKRYWSKRELLLYGYTKAMVRKYDKEKIAKENAERYEQIKKERGWK